MANVIHLKGASVAPKDVTSKMETVLMTANQMREWQIPPFQRELRVNEKVRMVAAEIKEKAGIIPGIITLGRLVTPNSNRATVWLVDGQHRREGFFITELPECIVDLRIIDFSSMSEMASEYFKLNSALVRMRPDDMLRALEGTLPALQMIRKRCPYVGYGHIHRRASSSSVLSMSMMLRCWFGSMGETPTGAAGRSAVQMAYLLDTNSAADLCAFLDTAHAAWGNDAEYSRLWAGLNLTMCMWMWRQLVMVKQRGIRRTMLLTPERFRLCLTSLSASPDYLQWITGRVMGDLARSPCYRRIKKIFQARLSTELGARKVVLLSPSWAAQ